MTPLRDAFDARVAEIATYLEFLSAVEKEIQSGTPRIGENGPVITATQQRILYSSVYLQLYNLVEATITRCLDAVCVAAIDGGQWRPGDLCTEMRREWVRSTARTHVVLTDEHRLKHAVDLVEQLVETLPIAKLQVETGGGSWDDQEIAKVSSRIGLNLVISPDVFTGVKRRLRNDKGALELIAKLRNDLAHGTLSFVECGENDLVADLVDLRDRAVRYLAEVVDAFQTWVDAYEFLRPERRPVGNAG